jgi:hypothetical protein
MEFVSSSSLIPTATHDAVTNGPAWPLPPQSPPQAAVPHRVATCLCPPLLLLLLRLHLSNLPGVPTYLFSPSTNPKQTQKFFFSPLGTNLPNFLALFFLGFRILFSSLFFFFLILQLLDFFCFKQFFLLQIFFSPSTFGFFFCFRFDFLDFDFDFFASECSLNFLVFLLVLLFTIYNFTSIWN